MTNPKPVWVTTEEGGNYIPWYEWTVDFGSDGSLSRWDMVGGGYRFRIHSVGFDNGWVFDNFGGWRPWDPSTFLPPAELEFAQKLEALRNTSTKALRQLGELEEANKRVRESLAEARKIIK